MSLLTASPIAEDGVKVRIEERFRFSFVGSFVFGCIEAQDVNFTGLS